MYAACIITPVCHATNSITNAPKQPVARSVHFDDTPLVIPLGLITPTVTEFAPAQTPRAVAALIREVEQLHEFDEFGDEGIDYDKKDIFAPFRNAPHGDENIDIVLNNTPCDVECDFLREVSECSLKFRKNRGRQLRTDFG